MSVLRYDEIFKRKIRTGDWVDQLVPTYQKIRQAIEAGKWEDAQAYIEYFHDEARIIYDLYTQWIADAKRCLADGGIKLDELEGIELDLKALVNHYLGGSYDRVAEWVAYRQLKAKLQRELHGQPEAALRTCADWKECWRSIHDRDVDYISGLFNTVAVRFGEQTIEKMYREYVIGNLFNFRYERFDVSKHKWEDIFPSLIYISIEAMRGHLVGPGREGLMELTEYEDRVVLEFDPCGSGGRTVRGEPLDGTFSRMQAPYSYQVMAGEHDFAWNKPGVCHYCVHCCVLMEKLPIERFGYPVRVVDPPTYPDRKDAKCRWTMYKRPEDVPEEVYRRVGESKPPSGTPLGSESRRQK